MLSRLLLLLWLHDVRPLCFALVTFSFESWCGVRNRAIVLMLFLFLFFAVSVLNVVSSMLGLFLIAHPQVPPCQAAICFDGQRWHHRTAPQLIVG